MEKEFAGQLSFPSIAEETTPNEELEENSNIPVRIPKGIDISEPETYTGAEVGIYPFPNTINSVICDRKSTDWCYLFIHHAKVKSFVALLLKDGVDFFIHRNVVFQRKKDTRGICSIEKPTISGLVFLRGNPKEIQAYLDANFQSFHLVKDCATGLPAVIPEVQMRPFRHLVESDPERIRILLHPLKYYAKGNARLRITSGYLSGLEGYVIRIDRDRRLVMEVGNMTVAISGVHCETFEVVKEA